MKSFTYTVREPIGLHARPAGDLVKAIRDYQCAITISGNGRTADGKKLLSVMTLGIRMGQEIMLTFEGEDEDKACAETESYVREHL
ncbi:HPr family phosphocarrier protein [Chordicoccus furentiruminis]|uniref:HPr family phosphocarrier protein n=1 Tax=Chordicoccus furentiruminis TaxID=2709410 RepID=UPI0023A8A20E|nr:HPr family phosphocarrier protein [Chordicoccus furentiruminis]